MEVRSHRNGHWWEFVLLILAIALAGCVSPPAGANGAQPFNPVPTSKVATTVQLSPSPATTASPTRALTYDEFVESMAELDRTLAANEPDTYAGYCFPVPGRREAAIAFTANAEETARKYLVGRPYEARVQVWTADYPLKLLKDNLRPELERIIDLYSANGMGGSVDQCKDRIVIFVPSLAAVEAALEASGSPLPDYVELIEDTIEEE